mmetsp:Transcript_51071/g.116295  ORF Transcript_51071/g.116295 Transcript_51071/m.116295 type:complete len:114 (-) Transcript_51071:59-400(-)
MRASMILGAVCAAAMVKNVEQCSEAEEGVSLLQMRGSVTDVGQTMSPAESYWQCVLGVVTPPASCTPLTGSRAASNLWRSVRNGAITGPIADCFTAKNLQDISTACGAIAKTK